MKSDNGGYIDCRNSVTQLLLSMILYRFSKIRDNKVNFFEPNLRGNGGRFLKAMAHNKIVHTLAFIEDSGLS